MLGSHNGLHNGLQWFDLTLNIPKPNQTIKRT